jgi:hypothetical protein
VEQQFSGTAIQWNRQEQQQVQLLSGAALLRSSAREAPLGAAKYYNISIIL